MNSRRVLFPATSDPSSYFFHLSLPFFLSLSLPLSLVFSVCPSVSHCVCALANAGTFDKRGHFHQISSTGIDCGISFWCQVRAPHAMSNREAQHCSRVLVLQRRSYLSNCADDNQFCLTSHEKLARREHSQGSIARVCGTRLTSTRTLLLSSFVLLWLLLV